MTGTIQPQLFARIKSWSAMLGQYFGGKRDLYGIFGWRTAISSADLMFKYQRQDIASRVVEADPRACWASPPKPISDDEFSRKWQDATSRTNLFHHIYRLDNMIGMHSYGGLLLGFDDGKNLSVPLSGDSAKNLTFVQPYGADSLEIKEFDGDPQSPLYAMPKMYTLKAQSVQMGNTFAFKSSPISVHASRIIHVAENTLETPVYGNPRLIRAFNTLDDILKTIGGAAETYWMASDKGLQADIDKDLELDTDEAAELSDEIEEYQHQLRRFIRTRGVTIKDLGGKVADPRGVFSAQIGLLSAATGIPQRILLGAEAGQLASTQDRANWAVRVEERRELFAEPIILNPLVQRLVFAGVLPMPEKLAWNWPDAFKQSPLERSMTSAQRARTLANVSKALSDENPPITKEEGRTIIGLDEPEPIFNDPGDVTVNLDTQGDQE